MGPINFFAWNPIDVVPSMVLIGRFSGVMKLFNVKIIVKYFYKTLTAEMNSVCRFSNKHHFAFCEAVLMKRSSWFYKINGIPLPVSFFCFRQIYFTHNPASHNAAHAVHVRFGIRISPPTFLHKKLLK